MFSRPIAFAAADPRKLDTRGTLCNAVPVSAIFYSIFVSIPFGKLVIADVLLYPFALFLEFGAPIPLRKREPVCAARFASA